MFSLRRVAVTVISWIASELASLAAVAAYTTPLAVLLKIAAIAQDNFEFAFVLRYPPIFIERTLNRFDIPTTTILSQDIAGSKIEQEIFSSYKSYGYDGNSTARPRGSIEWTFKEACDKRAWLIGYLGPLDSRDELLGAAEIRPDLLEQFPHIGSERAPHLKVKSIGGRAPQHDVGLGKNRACAGALRA